MVLFSFRGKNDASHFGTFRMLVRFSKYDFWNLEEILDRHKSKSFSPKQNQNKKNRDENVLKKMKIKISNFLKIEISKILKIGFSIF